MLKGLNLAHNHRFFFQNHPYTAMFQSCKIMQTVTVPIISKAKLYEHTLHSEILRSFMLRCLTPFNLDQANNSLLFKNCTF